MLRAQASEAAEEVNEADHKDKKSAGFAQAEADAAAGVGVQAISSSEEDAPRRRARRGLQSSLSDPATPLAQAPQGKAKAAKAAAVPKVMAAPKAAKAAVAPKGVPHPAQATRAAPAVSKGSSGAASGARPTADTGAGARGKKPTDVLAHSQSLAIEYAFADETSVFFSNDLNHAQMRSITRYEGQVRDKIAAIPADNPEKDELGLVLKRYQLIEAGIKIVRLKLGCAKEVFSH